jgi:TonB family protein
MSETWKQWEGRTVDGKFPLQSYLGGSDHSVVFLTVTPVGVGDPEKAAIKLIPADPADAQDQLLRWKATSELTHPNLIRIFATGRCELGGTKFLYIVMEYAEENLSQILPERALTPEEARGLLPPALRALRWMHEKGYAHGHMQPSNILAIGDEVKLSSDALCVPGERGTGATTAYDPPEAVTGTISTATDVWQLGLTLAEVLTQHLPAWDRAGTSAPEVPEAVPEPFRDIARHCLRIDAGQRWTVAEISDRLEGEGQKTTSVRSERVASGALFAGQHRESKKWPYVLGLAAAVVVVFFFISRPKPSGSTAEVQSTETQQGAATEGSQSAPLPTETTPKSSPTTTGKIRSKSGDEKSSANPEAAAADNQSGVVQRVMPQVSPSARHTIQGTIKVRVRVEVDGAGNVAEAKLESAGPSQYFSRLALEAARAWKFSPLQAGESGERAWKLQFAYTRAKTEASALRVKR